MSFQDFKALVALTFRDPQDAARMLLAQNWPVPARWMALIAAVCVSAVLAYISTLVFPMPDPAVNEMPSVLSLTRMPLALAVMQCFAVTIAAALMAGVGRMFGGKGSFDDALLLTVWIEVTLLLVQVIQIALSLVLPALAGMLGIVAIVVFLWLTVQFTKTLHDFKSGPRVAMGLFATALVAGFALSFLAAAFGLIPEVPQ